MDATEAVGWASSLVLVATIGAQIRKQWHDDTSRGVSPWLFVGQAVASIGFLAYSVLRGNAVFAVTNSLMLVAALAGITILVRHRRRGRAGAA